MLLGFKRQFAPMVLDGSKTHTIRARRKIPARVGETCHCYVDPRQKSMQLLGRWECVRIEPIFIVPFPMPEGAAWHLDIWIAGSELTPDEAVEFAWRDGFRPVRRCDALISMGHWWAALKRIDAFQGHLIHWKYDAAKAGLVDLGNLAPESGGQ
jgi:hypothetical protein